MNTWSALALALSLSACGAAPAPAQPGVGVAAAAPRSVDIASFKADIDRNAVPFLVDVRTSGEYAAGHVPGAVNIPLDEIGARASEIPSKDAEVYVICQSGRRSAAASAQLAAQGYKPVNVEGGTGAWIAAGHPVQ